MEQHVEAIREWKDGKSITALSEVYGVSRKTIYKWIGREASQGTAGLEDRSRAPLNSPQKLSEAVVERLKRASVGDGGRANCW